MSVGAPPILWPLWRAILRPDQPRRPGVAQVCAFIGVFAATPSVLFGLAAAAPHPAQAIALVGVTAALFALLTAGVAHAPERARVGR